MQEQFRQREERERREREERERRKRETSARTSSVRSGAGSLAIGGDRASDFEVLEKLGSGGFGQVYKVKRYRDGTEYALKQIPMNRESSLLVNEVFVMKTLNHKNILKFEDAWLGNKEMYLLLELCSGGSLYDFFDAAYEAASVCADPKSFQNPFLLPGNLEAMLFDLVGAIAYCEAKNIVHADIKPDNILLSQIPADGGKTMMEIPKLADFGLANMISLTKTHLSKRLGGTSGYMAPEVLLGETADTRADVYSLGVTFWQLVTLRHPFQGKTEVQIHEFLKTSQLSLSSADLPNLVYRNIINSMLSNDKKNRPKASQILDQLSRNGLSRPAAATTSTFRVSAANSSMKASGSALNTKKVASFFG
eukprot:ANDGO_08417.mRNA.1 Serine/threonine-protein kinase ATG1c